MSKQTLKAEIIAYYRGEEPFLCATLNSEDVERIERITTINMLDGAEQVTVKVRGTEYDPGAWIAYVTGILDTVSPLPVRNGQP